MIVENTFARLKGRWRCLLKCLEEDVLNICTTIGACCVLHNFCIIRGDLLDDEDLFGEDDVPECDGGDGPRDAPLGAPSAAIRNALVVILN